MKYKILIILLLVSLFLPLVNSFEFDNIKQATNIQGSDYPKVKIKNAFGLGDTLWEGELKKNTHICLVDCSAEKEITLENPGSLIDDIKFETISNSGDRMEKEIRDYNFYIKTGEIEKTIQDYEWPCVTTGWSSNGTEERSCSKVNVGSHLESEPIWEEYIIGTEVPAGTYLVKLEGKKYDYETIDWIIKSKGRWISEWAEWTSSLGTQLKAFWRFDNVSDGTDAIDALGIANFTVENNWTTGLIGMSFLPNGTAATKNTTLNSLNFVALSYNFWVFKEQTVNNEFISTPIDVGAPAGNGAHTIRGASCAEGATRAIGVDLFDASRHCFDQCALIGDNLWTMVTVTLNSTSSRIYTNGSLTASCTLVAFNPGANNELGLFGNGPAVSTSTRFDEFGIWNRTLTEGEITSLYNFGFGMSFPFNVTNVSLDSPTNNFVSSSTSVEFNCSATHSAQIFNMSLLTNQSGVLQIENFTTSLNGTSNETSWIHNLGAEGEYDWTCQACDNETDCGLAFPNRIIEVDLTDPVVLVTTPTGDQGEFTFLRNLTLTWSASDSNLQACFYDYNGFNTTVGCGTSPNNLTVLSATNLTLVFYANDSGGNVGSDNTNWTYTGEIAAGFSANVSETDSETFQVNITTTLNILSISAILDYNGTEHISTSSCPTSNNCTVENTIDIPLVITGESQENNFFWNISLFDGSSETQVATSIRTQNVSRIHLEECDATFTVQSLNFSAWNEADDSRISPFYFAGSFDIWLGGGSVKRPSSVVNFTEIEMDLCIDPVHRNFSADANIEYNNIQNSTLFNTRNFFLQQDLINNDTQHLPLFLLFSDDSTSFILKVQDTNLLPVTDALIVIQRFNPGTGNFTNVSIAKTDDNGQTVGFFKTETVDYRFIIKKNGVILLTTTQQKIVPETAPFTLTFTLGEDTGAPWAVFEDIANLTSILVYNATSGNVTYTYVDVSNAFTLGRLTLERTNPSNSTASIICNVTSSQASATLICGTGNVTGEYIASVFVARGGSEFLVAKIIFKVETFSSVVGLLGVFLAWFVILISAFAFKFNEVAGIVLMNITVLMVNLIGLVNFGGIFIFGMMGVSIILIVLLKK